MSTAPRQRRVSGNPLVALVVFALFGTLVTSGITLGAWPGEARYTAPILCPDHQPDAFVVEETERLSGSRTGRNYSMFCVGPRGDFTEIGFLRPFLVLIGVHTLLLMAVALVFILVLAVGSRGARRRGPTAPIPPPAWG